MEHEPRLRLDEEAAAAEHAMDALGAAERDAAPAGLEARVLAASLVALRAGDGQNGPPGLRVDVAGRRGLGRQGWHRRRVVAIAAGLGVVACVTGFWFAVRGGGGGAGPVRPGPVVAGADGRATGGSGVPGVAAAAGADAEVEAIFAASLMLGSDVDQEIATIRVEAASLGLDLADPLAGPVGLSEFGGTWGGGSL